MCLNTTVPLIFVDLDSSLEPTGFSARVFSIMLSISSDDLGLSVAPALVLFKGRLLDIILLSNRNINMYRSPSRFMNYGIRKIQANNRVYKVVLPPFWIRANDLVHGYLKIEIEENKIILTPVGDL